MAGGRPVACTGRAGRRGGAVAFLSLALAFASAPAAPLDRVIFTAPGADGPLVARLRAASLVLSAEREKTGNSQTVFAAARADYARLIG
ncbi:MAG: hypothetical protein ACK4NE_06780, partial [Albidovulum sp.]